MDGVIVTSKMIIDGVLGELRKPNSSDIETDTIVKMKIPRKRIGSSVTNTSKPPSQFTGKL